MSSDNKNGNDTASEEAFYESDYDEDTVDYDLDSDIFLEDEQLNPEAATIWGVDAPPSGSVDELQNEYSPEPEYEKDLDADEKWCEEDETNELQEEYIDSWPLSLIAVGIIALLLLAAGGYGVLQQRTEMQEEIRQLRATLATTSSNTELAASRQSQRSLAAHTTELQAQVEQLLLENQSLREDMASSPPTTTPLPSEPSKVGNAAEVSPQPIEPKAFQPSIDAKADTSTARATKATTEESTWFVNFSSYTQEATANSWASRIKVENGRVVVIMGDNNGTRYYRVRVIDLPNKKIAGKIALQLEKTYRLPRLWVGKQ